MGENRSLGRDVETVVDVSTKFYIYIRTLSMILYVSIIIVV